MKTLCKHVWDQLKYDPITYQTFYFPFLLDIAVTDKVEDRWSKRCRQCGKVEYTEKISEGLQDG